jgi:hypothetical protein
MARFVRFFLSLISTSAPLTALAEPPQVQFDVRYAVACRDVTPEPPPSSLAGLKLIEAKLEISTLLAGGQEKDLTHYMIRVEHPQRALSIVDYLPKTRHEAVAKSVTVENGSERVAALGINLSGKYELLTLPGPSAGIGSKKSSSVKQELLPPVETVAASGTLARGTALFFKIKATAQNRLEGTREYAIVLSVPANWRADYLHVNCEAVGIRRGMVTALDENIRCGQRRFVVALYQDGDLEARRIAENFARREAAKTPTQARSASKGFGSAYLAF